MYINLNSYICDSNFPNVNPMPQNREEILKAHQFEGIYNQYYPVVKYFALMLLKSEEDAEDIAQDVFTKLWSQPEIWTNVPNLTPYIYTLTKSTTLNFIKHKKVEQAYQEQIIEKSLIEELSQADDPLNSLYYKEIQLIIKLTLNRLPEQRRKIFEMSRFQHLSNNEIAEKLNISVRTVEHHIYLTLAELKKLSFLLFLALFFK